MMNTCFSIQVNKNALISFLSANHSKGLLRPKYTKKNFKKENLLKGHRVCLVSKGELIKYFHDGHFVI